MIKKTSIGASPKRLSTSINGGLRLAKNINWLHVVSLQQPEGLRTSRMVVGPVALQKEAVKSMQH